jgi:hypothetical protein
MTLKTNRNKILFKFIFLIVLVIVTNCIYKHYVVLLGSEFVISENKLENYVSSYHETLGEFTLETFETDSWIINENLLQYGTIMSLREDNQIEIEAILWVVDPKNVDIKFLKCFVKLNSNVSILADVFEILPWHHSPYYGSLVHNAKCLLSVEQYRRVKNNEIVVSMIDMRDFKNQNSNISVNFFGLSLG